MRILLYCVGLLFLAFGVAFSVNSNLGVSPVNSLPYVISLILKVDLGRCIIGVFVVYMVVQIIIKRKEPQWTHLPAWLILPFWLTLRFKMILRRR